MKMLFMIVSMMGLPHTSADLTWSDRRFANTVVKLHGKKNLIEITKRQDKCIVIEYTETIYVLNPDGFIQKLYILEDGEWINLGPEY
jgi:hypothetical protein